MNADEKMGSGGFELFSFLIALRGFCGIGGRQWGLGVGSVGLNRRSAEIKGLELVRSARGGAEEKRVKGAAVTANMDPPFPSRQAAGSGTSWKKMRFTEKHGF